MELDTSGVERQFWGGGGGRGERRYASGMSCAGGEETGLTEAILLMRLRPVRPALPAWREMRGQCPSCILRPVRAVLSRFRRIPGGHSLGGYVRGFRRMHRDHGVRSRFATLSGRDTRPCQTLERTHTPLTSPPSKLRGQSPQAGQQVTILANLRVLSVLMTVPALLISRPSKLRGLSPQAGRQVTIVVNLRVLSVLTVVPAPLISPPSKLRGQSPQAGQQVTIVVNLRVLPVLTVVPTPLTSRPSKLRGLSPQRGSPSDDCCQSSGSVGSDGCARTAHIAAIEAAGTVPVSWSPSDDCCQSSGSIGSDACAGTTHIAAIEAAGTVPARGAESDDCYQSLGAIDSVGHTHLACSSRS